LGSLKETGKKPIEGLLHFCNALLLPGCPMPGGGNCLRAPSEVSAQGRVEGGGERVVMLPSILLSIFKEPAVGSSFDQHGPGEIENAQTGGNEGEDGDGTDQGGMCHTPGAVASSLKDGVRGGVQRGGCEGSI